MKLKQISSKALFLAALASVLSLFLLSDFSPPPAQGFGDAQLMDKEVQVKCLVLGCNQSGKGVVMELSDTEGMRVHAFCPYDAFDQAPSVGSVLEVTCRTSKEDKNFFFISSFQPLG